MNARTIVITAGAIVALAAPTAGSAGNARSPVHNHALLSEFIVSKSAIGTGRATEQTAAKLRVQLRAAERLSYKLGAQLRASKTRATALRAELKATKKLVAQLRAQLDTALSVARGDSTPAPAPLTPTVPYDYCTDYMAECTPEQLCRIWGLDCHLVPVEPAPIAEPVEAAPAVEPVESTPAAPADETPAEATPDPGSTTADPAVDPNDPYGYNTVY